MNTKELENIKKKSIYFTELSPNTKIQIVNSELNHISQSVKKQLNLKKDVFVAVFKSEK